MTVSCGRCQRAIDEKIAEFCWHCGGRLCVVCWTGDAVLNCPACRGRRLHTDEEVNQYHPSVAQIEAAVAAEREACAKIADLNEECEAADSCGVACSAGEQIAIKIRARGSK